MNISLGLRRLLLLGCITSCLPHPFSFRRQRAASRRESPQVTHCDMEASLHRNLCTPQLGQRLSRPLPARCWRWAMCTKTGVENQGQPSPGRERTVPDPSLTSASPGGPLATPGIPVTSPSAEPSEKTRWHTVSQLDSSPGHARSLVETEFQGTLRTLSAAYSVP